MHDHPHPQLQRCNAIVTIIESKVMRNVVRFPNPPMVSMAACPGADPSTTEHIGMDELVQVSFDSSIANWLESCDWLQVIQQQTRLPQRQYDEPFLFAVDHCFPIKGQGTVMTGTVLRGTVQVNDTIEFPGLRQEKKVSCLVSALHRSMLEVTLC